MTKKAWCKTAQLVLDHLHDNCDLIVCIHPGEWRNNGRHSYVWNRERGEAVRAPQDTIAERLIREGFVVETQRTPRSRLCYSYPFDRSDGFCWEVTYRATKENEDFKIHANRNSECETHFALLLDLQKQQESLLHLSLPSRATTYLTQTLDKTSTLLTTKLAGLPFDLPHTSYPDQNQPAAEEGIA